VLELARRDTHPASRQSNNTLRIVQQPSRLLLAAQPPDGGVARHVVSLVEALPRDRFAVDVACPRDSLTWASLDGVAGVTLHAIRPHRRRPVPGDASSWLTLLRLVGAADVIHVHSAKAGFLGRLAAAARGRRRSCIHTPHGWSFWAASGAEGRFYLGLERRAAHWCRTIVALSTDERDAGLRARVGRLEQYRVIPNGVHLERFDNERRPVPGRILLVGRLAPPKRPDLAVRALHQLGSSVANAELHLVGDGPLRAETERLAAELGVADRVRFLGARDDVPQLLAQAACLLLVSDYEGCPLVVVEAMAAGVPVVAAEVGGVNDLLDPGRTGFVTPAGDPVALAARLEEVLAHPALAAEMGAAGRREARSRLSIGGMTGRLTELYEEAASEHQ
jgi:glycosyltransferase involved in cell wall biosynthesis